MPQDERAAEEHRLAIRVGVEQLSSKQRNAVMGLIKDMGFTPEEIREIAVTLPGFEDDVERSREL